MLDTVLGIGASFDWLSPLASVLGDLVNGGGHTFLIPYSGSPMSGREIEIMLRRRGVRTWGAMVVSGTLMLTVRPQQARWAEHLLQQAGVPLENPAAPAPRTARQRPPLAQRSRIVAHLERRRS